MGMASFLMQTDINMLGSLKTKKRRIGIIYYTEWIKIYWSMEKWERNWAWNKTLL